MKLFPNRDEFIKLRFDREHVHGVYDHLTKQKQYCEERIFDEDRRFRRIIDMRQNTLEDIRVSPTRKHLEMKETCNRSQISSIHLMF